MHIFNEQKVIDIIQENKYSLVCLQMPEGIRAQAESLAELIHKETNAKAIIWADSCWGPCDTHHHAALAYVDALFHFGHFDTTHHKHIHHIHVNYNQLVPPHLLKKIKPLVEKYNSIGIITIITYINQMRQIQDAYPSILSAEGAFKKGIITGCNFAAAENQNVDAYLFIGSGTFHPKGVSLSTGKPVYVIDLELNDLYPIPEKEITLMLKKRILRITKAQELNRFIIYTSTKPGQGTMDLALECQEQLQKANKHTLIVLSDSITPDSMLTFKPDVIVNTACPRIAWDDASNFPAVIINSDDIPYVTFEKNIDTLVQTTVQGKQLEQDAKHIDI